ncbi:MAG TPA: PQQ-binding-like beta-propeller repeat protein [Coxiellaceae bacterium]|nr:PQQ-binding-like beta-propeller repeat protein [Coxiellaceae bacterium]
MACFSAITLAESKSKNICAFLSQDLTKNSHYSAYPIKYFHRIAWSVLIDENIYKSYVSAGMDNTICVDIRAIQNNQKKEIIKTYAIKDGKLLEQKVVNDQLYSIQNPLQSISDKESVFVSVPPDTIYAFDKVTQKIKWKTRLNYLAGFRTPLLISNNKLLSYSTQGLFVLNKQSGKLIWEDNRVDMGKLAVTDQYITYIGMMREKKEGANRYNKYHHGVFVFNINNGNILWHQYLPSFNPVTPSIAIAGDVVYFANSGIVYAVDLKTGKLYWKKELKGFISQLFPYEKRLYVLTAWHRIFVRNHWASDGAFLYAIE